MRLMDGRAGVRAAADVSFHSRRAWASCRGAWDAAPFAPGAGEGPRSPCLTGMERRPDGIFLTDPHDTLGFLFEIVTGPGI